MSTPKIMFILSENWTLINGQDLNTLIDWAVTAEEAGIDGVMLSEHVSLGRGAGSLGREANDRAYMAPGNQDPTTPWPSSLLLMSAIAARTSKIRIFGGAIIAPLRHPVQLAKDLSTLDCLASGRLIIQPTVSWHQEEYEQLGIPFSQRGRLLDEHLDAWRLLWQESPAAFDGEFYQFADCYSDPKPFRSGGPTLWFGGQSLHPALMRRLLEFGSGFHPFGSPSSRDLDFLAQSLSKVGRRLSDIELVGGIRATFPDSRSAANLEEAMASIPPQMEQGFTTFCVKPNQFVNHPEEIPEFCDHLVALFAEL